MTPLYICTHDMFRSWFPIDRTTNWTTFKITMAGSLPDVPDLWMATVNESDLKATSPETHQITSSNRVNVGNIII